MPHQHFATCGLAVYLAWEAGNCLLIGYLKRNPQNRTFVVAPGLWLKVLLINTKQKLKLRLMGMQEVSRVFGYESNQHTNVVITHYYYIKLCSSSWGRRGCLQQIWSQFTQVISLKTEHCRPHGGARQEIRGSPKSVCAPSGQKKCLKQIQWTYYVSLELFQRGLNDCLTNRPSDWHCLPLSQSVAKKTFLTVKATGGKTGATEFVKSAVLVSL